MVYERQDFAEFSADTGRVVVNLEAAFHPWVDATRQLAALPVSMYWQHKSGADYLAVKHKSGDSGTTLGARTSSQEAELEAWAKSKEAIKARLRALNQTLTERAQQYRALRLPVLPDRQGEILRELDCKGLLRHDLMVVGANAFAAYEIACNARFPVGNEETEDFDLAWCRGSRVSLTRLAPEPDLDGRPSLFAVLAGIDSTFRINKRKPYQALNDADYEVELLAAPSAHPLPRAEAFDPMGSLVEQEWLLMGRPISCVVATVRHRACPLYVPDPRWMALYKLWLSDKPGRNPSKKAKDKRQGLVLLDATRHFLREAYPMDIDFVLELPAELRDLFNAWAQGSGYDPLHPDGSSSSAANGR